MTRVTKQILTEHTGHSQVNLVDSIFVSMKNQLLHLMGTGRGVILVFPPNQGWESCPHANFDLQESGFSVNTVLYKLPNEEHTLYTLYFIPLCPRSSCLEWVDARRDHSWARCSVQTLERRSGRVYEEGSNGLGKLCKQLYFTHQKDFKGDETDSSSTL